MKSLLQIFLLFISINVTAQIPVWETQESGTSNNLNDIFFLSDDYGYIVGDEGTVLKTTNGGDDWTTLNIGLSENFNTLWFFDEENGFIAGSNGNSLYKTADGGMTWESIEHSLNTDPWLNILSIFFINENVGFVGTDDGFMRTMDGGTSWTTIESYALIRKIDFLDEFIGFAYCSQGILKTTDGGLNWELYKAMGDPDFNNGAILRSIQVMSEDTVYFGAPYYSAFYSSFDGGSTLNYQLMSIVDMDFLTTQMGFTISIMPGVGLTIKKTTDMGETWSTQFEIPIISINELKTLWMHNENEGWAAGNNGNIRHLVVSLPNAIEEIDKEKLVVFPNPTTDFLFLSNNDFSIDNIRVFDINGKICSTQLSDQKYVDVTHLPAGKYFLQLESKGNIRLTSFIKE